MHGAGNSKMVYEWIQFVIFGHFLSINLSRMNQLAPSRYPSLPQAWAIFGIFVIVSLGLGLLLGTLLPAMGISNQSIINFLGYNISLPLVIWIAWRIRPKPVPGEKFLYANRIQPILYIDLLFLALSLNVVLDPLANAIPMPEFIEKIFAMLTSRDIWTFLTVGITGPILEEVLFRGIILEGFLNRYKPQKAIFWSALLFGLFHMNPWQFIPAFITGLLLGYLYLKTRSILPVIFIHIIINSTSYMTVFVFGEEVMSYRDIVPDTGSYLILMAASLAVFLACFAWLVIKVRHKIYFHQENP
jgi:membrane protease YdiL (CAAX protease family)